jgi:hypothetical protein
MVREVLGALLGHLTEPTISTFVDLTAKNPDSLHQLEALIREKRRRQHRAGVQPSEDDG